MRRYVGDGRCQARSPDGFLCQAGNGHAGAHKRYDGRAWSDVRTSRALVALLLVVSLAYVGDRMGKRAQQRTPLGQDKARDKGHGQRKARVYR